MMAARKKLIEEKAGHNPEAVPSLAKANDEVQQAAVLRIEKAFQSGQSWLDLGDFPIISVPEEIGKLKEQLTELLLGPVRLDYAHVEYCRIPLADIKHIASLNKLTYLSLLYCFGVTCLRPLSELKQLTYLKLGHCKGISDLGPLSELKQLTYLNLGHCDGISDLGPLSELKQLTYLELVHCDGISDLGPLSELKQLTYLELGYSHGISDLGPLSVLKQLTYLNLAYSYGISDLGPLSELKQLATLVIYACIRILDLGPLSELKQLTWLNLHSCKGISDLRPLSELKQLTWLNLSSCEGISNLGPLSELKQLTTLNLHSCDGISDLGPLSELKQLAWLNLSSCEGISNLGPLSELKQLTTLNLSSCEGISNLGPLSELKQLTTLYLRSCKGISDLGPLSELKQLTTLDLDSCDGISDLGPLSELKQLTTLEISSCKAVKFHPIRSLLNLHKLHVHDTRFSDLHPAVCGSDRFCNALHSVREYYAANDSQSQPDAEIKVFVLGNGRAGKTSLIMRLKGNSAQKVESAPPSSTHGLTIESYPVPQEWNLPHPVQLCLWDFGGQDIYHGTHALFLHGPALYLLLYAHATEDEEDVSEGGFSIRNRRLPYWFDYLRQEAGIYGVVGNPLLLIQSRCNEPPGIDKTPPHRPDPVQFPQASDVIPVNAHDERGLRHFYPKLEDALGSFLQQHPRPPLPTSWVNVRQAIHTLREKNVPVLSQEEFRKLCQEQGCPSDPKVVLEALHQMGVVFFRSGLFNEQIVVDQLWILNKIYTIFDRTQHDFRLDVADKGGKFRRRDLSRHFWKDHAVADQRLYLSFMEQCGICFRTDTKSDTDYKGLYIAPDLLPGWAEVSARYVGLKADASVTANFILLHDGITRSFLAKIGQVAGDFADYWRFGCHFRDAATQSEVIVRTVGNGIRMEARDGNATELLQTLLKVLNQVPCGAKPNIIWDNLAPAPERESMDHAKPELRLRPELIPPTREEIEKLKALLTDNTWVPDFQAFYLIACVLQADIHSMRKVSEKLEKLKLPAGVSASRSYVSDLHKEFAKTLKRELNWNVKLIEGVGNNSRLTRDGLRAWVLVGVVLQELDMPGNRTWEPIAELLQREAWLVGSKNA